MYSTLYGPVPYAVPQRTGCNSDNLRNTVPSIQQQKRRGRYVCSMNSKTVTEEHIGHEICFNVRQKFFLLFFEIVFAVTNIQRVTLEHRAEKHAGLHVK